VEDIICGGEGEGFEAKAGGGAGAMGTGRFAVCPVVVVFKEAPIVLLLGRMVLLEEDKESANVTYDGNGTVVICGKLLVLDEDRRVG